MKYALLSFFILLGINLKSQDSDIAVFFQKTNSFLSSTVLEGKVNYSSIKNNPDKLNELVKNISAQDLANLNEVEKKAFYINAYNLLVIESIVAEYPTNSPQKITGFFDGKKHQVAGESLTLNQIEKERLNPGEDPRLHFVLVCAALSCPVLEPFAYTPQALDEQLTIQTKKALNNRSFIKIDEKENSVELSKLFSWYKSDFIKKGNTLLDYINSYRINQVPSDYNVSFYEYDWSLNEERTKQQLDDREEVELSNLQAFTPSALFNKGEYEINVFNSIYSQQKSRNSKGDLVDLGGTQSFFTSLIQFTTGINQSGRINVGVDVNVVKAKYSNDDESGIAVLTSNGASYQKTVISSIAPRIKFNPFKSIPRLSVQSSLLIPIAKNQQSAGPNSSYFIAHDRYSWFTQVFFDKSFGEKFQLFLEADLLYRFDYNNANEEDFFRVPLSAFMSYFPTSESTVYVFSQYSPRFENVANSGAESSVELSQWFTQLGIGAKYQLTSKIGLEVSYADFVLSRNDGAGYNLNFGVRYIYR